MNARRILLELCDVALRAVDGRACVERVLRNSSVDPVAVFAVGKAASAMALGAQAALADRVEQLFVVTKDGHVDPQLRRMEGATILESAHPVPDARSLAAGAELARRVSHLRDGVWPIFLVSGGSSSLVEWLREGESLEGLRALNERGLAAGWDIAKLNTERTRISRLKGGGMTRLLGSREALALFISDVPGDDPGVIGSGLLGRGDVEDRITRVIVANLEVAVGAAVEAGAARGLALERARHRFDGEASTVASAFVEALRATTADGLVWAGESTVTLPNVHGRGGRNTHLALAIARLLRANETWHVLAAGTDGTDGPTDDAGAIVDSGTIERAEIAGCDVERAWREFDSGTALEASEDLVHTGPTGTNVGDILIAIKQSANSLRGDPLPRML
jgi:hydroxypyruvate reductase